MATQIIPELSAEVAKPQAKKKLVRRTQPDSSQVWRRSFQLAFLLLNLYLGVVFYFWVRQFETGEPSSLARSAGVEGYLPIAGLMNVRYWLLTGRVPDVHPAAMFLLLAFVAIAFLFRKAFCSWLCPVGTISEYLWRAGRKLFRRNFHLPRYVDVPLRGLKYLLLAFFLWAVMSMGADAIDGFMHSPYGVIADVKMLNFFRFLGITGAVVIGILAIASVLVQNFWCRFLCPYGALLGLASLLSPLRIRRDADACIDCAKCAKACPSALAVDKLISIRYAECTGCLECVAVCPAEGALQMSLLMIRPAKKARVRAWAIAAGVAAIFLGTVAYARIAGHWQVDPSRQVYMQLVPHANEATHPMPGGD